LRIRILLPTFNENANIEAILRRIFEVVPGVEVLVIDDSSPDGTAATVERLRAGFQNLKLLLRPYREGLGKAYLAGMDQSLDAADALITMDADFSHDPAHLPGLIEAGRSHDLVIGSRYTASGGVDGWEFWRRVLSAGGNRYSRIVTGMPFRDCTSGLMLLRTPALRRLDRANIAASGYAFLIELKYRLWRSGATSTETPIIFRARRGGESKLSSHIVAEGVITPWRLRLSRIQ
jgi:dolichol-phosphate mannosyltransferase